MYQKSNRRYSIFIYQAIMFVHFYQMYLDYCFQGLKKKDPEPQLFSRVGGIGCGGGYIHGVI